MYHVILNGEGAKVYIKNKSIKRFQRLEALIFDCDGVLIDVSNSYRRTILETLRFYFSDLLGLKSMASPLSQDEIQMIKDSGGFNDDWECTCSALLYVLSLFVIKCHELGILGSFQSLSERISGSNLSEDVELIQRFGALCGSTVSPQDVTQLKGEPSFSFSDFLSGLKDNGLPSAERSVSKMLKDTFSKNPTLLVKQIKKIINYGEDVDTSLLKRVFEEIYLGSPLFHDFYKLPSLFSFDRGLIENEKAIPRPNLFNDLSKLGVKAFSVVSGRPRDQALYMLERLHILNQNFVRDSFMFFEDVCKDEIELYKESGLKVKLGKPNPHSLLESIRRMGLGREEIGYVGDTTSDILMVVNSSKCGDVNILGIGTLSNTRSPTTLLEHYRRLGADAIVQDINDLTLILENVKEEIFVA